jgi:MFS family permease
MANYSTTVLKNPEFIKLLIMRLMVAVTLQAQAVVVGWQVYSITKDPLYLGLIGLTEAVPAITAALFAGYIVDRVRPYFVLKCGLIVLVINTLILYAIAGEHLDLDSSFTLPVIFTCVFISGLARSFLIPANFALIPLIVKRADLSAASAWLSSGFHVASISGPALAGIIYGVYGASEAWLLPLITMIIAAMMMFNLKTVRDYKNAPSTAKAMDSIKEGWFFILKNPVMLSVMTLDMFAILFGGAVAMLPVYAAEVLYVGSEGLGLLRASPAIGALLIGLYLAFYPVQTISAKRLLLAVAGFGLCIIGFGLSEIFWLSCVFLALSGGADCISMVYRNTIMQWLTPDHMRGRVASVNGMFITSSNEIGAFESGISAKALGTVPSVVFGGMMTLLVVASIAWLSPQFRKTVLHADEMRKHET